ncbi:MAG: FMN-binding protein [Nanoarchaeota archaeon]
MKKIKQIIILVAVVVLSCALIISAHLQTKPIIKERQEKILNERIVNIFPMMTDSHEIKEDELYEIYKDESLIGYIVIAEAYGYQSKIQVLVGFEKNMKIKKIFVLNEEETPGIGSQITEDEFRSQFTGLTKESVALSDKDGEIDSVTGATASSKAVVEAVKNAFEVLRQSE